MVLDANALPEIVDGQPEIAKVLTAQDFAIPVIVLGEFQFGVTQSNRPMDYERWLVDP